jgi:DNA-directed RNA polymerase specialized sigma24 family protein
MIELTPRLLGIPHGIVGDWIRRGIKRRHADELLSDCFLALVLASRSYDPEKDLRANKEGAGETYLFKCVKRAAYRSVQKILRTSSILPLSSLKRTNNRGRESHYEVADKLNLVAETSRRDEVRRLKTMVDTNDWNLLWDVHGRGYLLREVAVSRGLSHQRIQQKLVRLVDRLRELSENEEVLEGKIVPRKLRMTNELLLDTPRGKACLALAAECPLRLTATDHATGGHLHLRNRSTGRVACFNVTSPHLKDEEFLTNYEPSLAQEEFRKALESEK